MSDPMNAPTRGRRLAVLLATVLALALTVRLGFWQLDRARQKTERHTQLVERGAQPPLAARELAGDAPGADAQSFRRARLTGRFVEGRDVFLDNRRMDERVGFYVLSPFRMDDGRAIVVQRGFVLRRFDERGALPTVPLPEGPMQITGTLQAGSPSRLWQFGEAGTGAIRQNLDLDAYARETGLALVPMTLLQADDGAPADGLLRHWPRPSADVQKHHGYAFQWFMLAATIVALHVWFRYVQPRRRARR